MTTILLICGFVIISYLVIRHQDIQKAKPDEFEKWRMEREGHSKEKIKELEKKLIKKRREKSSDDIFKETSVNTVVLIIVIGACFIFATYILIPILD